MATQTPHQRLSISALGIAGYGFWLAIFLRELISVSSAALRIVLAMACFLIVSEMDYQDELLITTYQQQANP